MSRSSSHKGGRKGGGCKTCLIALLFVAAVSAIGYIVYDKLVKKDGKDGKEVAPARGRHYGMKIGDFKSNGVKGGVYAVSKGALFIEKFSYEGNAGDGTFWTGESATPDETGVGINDYYNQTTFINKTDCMNMVLYMPTQPSQKEIKAGTYLALWDKTKKASIDFVKAGTDFVVPAEKEVGPFQAPPNGMIDHGVSGTVKVMDSNTIAITGFNYDGEGPDTYFIMGHGTPPAHATKLQDEKGSWKKLDKYTNQNIVVQVPQGKTVMDFDYFAIYCFQAHATFAMVKLNWADLKGIPANAAHLKYYETSHKC